MTDETTATEANTERTAIFSTAFIKKHWLKLTLAAVFIAALWVCLALTHQLPPIWPVESSEQYKSQSGFDLASQRWMAISSVITSITAIGTLFLLAWTVRISLGMLDQARTTTNHAAKALKAANDQAKAAENSVKVTESLALMQSQAYVDAPEASIEFLIEEYTTELLHFKLQLRNTGKTPATDILITYDYQLNDYNSPVSRHDNIFDKMELVSSQVNLPPDGNLEIILNIDAPHYNKYNEYILYGEIYYSTIYGQRHLTQFAFKADITDNIVPVTDENDNEIQTSQTVKMISMHHLNLISYENAI